MSKVPPPECFARWAGGGAEYGHCPLQMGGPRGRDAGSLTPTTPSLGPPATLRRGKGCRSQRVTWQTAPKRKTGRLHKHGMHAGSEAPFVNRDADSPIVPS